MAATKLTVISEDAGLIAMCREALRDLAPAGAWELLTATENLASSTGVCLWDYAPGHTFVSNPATLGLMHLFLVNPKDLDEFRRAIPLADGSILLKPVTRAVLQAFLGSLVSSPSHNSLRAQRDELLGCLLEANLKLQEYDRRRTNFLARAVHEFRVPLTALTGFCGLLSAGELGDLNPNQLDALHRMQHSLSRMTRMTTAMFELSIAGQGGGQDQPRPHSEEGNLAECLDQAIKLMRPLTEEKSLHIISANLLPADLPLFFENEQIEQVLVNLLDNACKASPRHGSIEIRGYPYFWERRFLAGDRNPLAGDRNTNDRRRLQIPAPNSYRIDIRDQGPGVHPEHIESIFEEYTSYFGPNDRSGGGLGLAICRLIVERHNGRIWAASEPTGAVFSFVLPYATAKKAQKAPVPGQRSQTA